LLDVFWSSPDAGPKIHSRKRIGDDGLRLDVVLCVSRSPDPSLLLIECASPKQMVSGGISVATRLAVSR
jgi:hypothetical protein